MNFWACLTKTLSASSASFFSSSQLKIAFSSTKSSLYKWCKIWKQQLSHNIKKKATQLKWQKLNVTEVLWIQTTQEWEPENFLKPCFCLKIRFLTLLIDLLFTQNSNAKVIMTDIKQISIWSKEYNIISIWVHHFSFPIRCKLKHRN